MVSWNVSDCAIWHRPVCIWHIFLFLHMWLISEWFLQKHPGYFPWRVPPFSECTVKGKMLLKPEYRAYRISYTKSDTTYPSFKFSIYPHTYGYLTFFSRHFPSHKGPKYVQREIEVRLAIRFGKLLHWAWCHSITT